MRRDAFRVSGLFAIAAVLAVSASDAPVQAAESASGAYALGLRGPGAGVTPPEGLFFSNQVFVYSGRIRGNLPFEGGAIAARARVTPAVNIPTLLWMTPLELGGARLGLSLTAPFGNVDVRARVGPFERTDSVFSFADPSVTAFLGGRTAQVHWQLGATGFLPVGDYRAGELANISKNRGALDVFGAVTWLEPTWNLDVTNVVGFTFNQRNEATRYRTGTEFHWEWAVARKFDDALSVGAVGYVYRQLGADTGPGAALGAFSGQASAVGTSLGYDFQIGRLPVAARLRFYHEVEAVNRLRGNSAFLSVSVPLWVPSARAP